MPRERAEDQRRRTSEILRRLRKKHPRSEISLTSETPFQLLVSVMLSAQCTDAVVNQVTQRLFVGRRTAKDFAKMRAATLERLIFSTGFYRQKAKNILATARRVEREFGGRVPDTMQELVSLPGVARKTANVVLWNAFGKREGIAVDTHVHRISGLLRLSMAKDPDKVERDLMRLVPKRDWGTVTHTIIEHGRATCIARRPRCADCVVNDLCPSRQD